MSACASCQHLVGMVDTKDAALRHLAAGQLMNIEEFAKSYAATITEFTQAIRDCIADDDYSLDNALTRKYEEGFADAMAHAFTLLVGHPFAGAVDTLQLESILRDETEDRPAFTCPACNQLREFEDGSGDCQACIECCKCIGQVGQYCMPY